MKLEYKIILIFYLVIDQGSAGGLDRQCKNAKLAVGHTSDTSRGF